MCPRSGRYQVISGPNLRPIRCIAAPDRPKREDSLMVFFAAERLLIGTEVAGPSAGACG
jgi:hypothetical protein